jgi:hypothetical protein
LLQIVEDIEVKKFSGADGEGRGITGDVKGEISSKGVIEGKAARAVFKVLQVEAASSETTSLTYFDAVFMDIRGWNACDVVQRTCFR